MPILKNRDQALIDIKKRLKRGEGVMQIRQYLKENYETSNKNIQFLVQEAQQNLEREMDFNLRDIILRHTARYEQIWKKNYQNPFSKKLDNPDDDMDDKDVRKTLYKIANHYEMAAEALQRKEKVLGIVHNRMDVQLRNELSEQEQKNEPNFDDSKFDPSKLTLAENLELLQLLKKAKGEFEEQTTKVTTTVTVTQNERVDEAKYEQVIDKFDIEDVDHEVIEEVPGQLHVEKINQSLIDQEAKRLDDKIKADKEVLRKQRIAEKKKKIVAKYRKKK